MASEKYPQAKTIYETARQNIRKLVLSAIKPNGEIDVSADYEASKAIFQHYVTLDFQHRLDLVKIRTAIQDYAFDRTRKRPLNIIMQAEPGSGKSHLVKCLAHSIPGVEITSVDYNMACLQSLDDLVQPLDAVRNLKVNDKLPLLFLDEFDSNPERNYPLLLPLLWDGELHVGHRDLKLGKVVIILAGSSGKICEAMDETKRMMLQTKDSAPTKLIDLLSRINGGELSIPPLDLVGGDRDRVVDKVCLTISLLQKRFGKEIEVVPWSLLKFVAESKFRHGVRSITHLIDLVAPSKQIMSFSDLENPSRGISREQCKFPFGSVRELRESSLAYHLVSNFGPEEVIELWKALNESSAVVRVLPKATKGLSAAGMRSPP